MGCKCIFVSVALVNFNPRVPRASVQCRKQGRLFQTVSTFVRTREGVRTANLYGLQPTVVVAKLQWTVLFGDGQDRCFQFGGCQFDDFLKEPFIFAVAHCLAVGPAQYGAECISLTSSMSWSTRCLDTIIHPKYLFHIPYISPIISRKAGWWVLNLSGN